MQVIIIEFENGVGRMQYYGDPTDEDIKKEVERGNYDKSLGAVVSWQRASLDDFPTSPAYRAAWRVMDGKVKEDIEKAKDIQKQHMIAKAHERAKDDFGRIKQETIDEIEAIDTKKAKSLDELYNMWPASIETRSSPRSYD